ncbi:hypothetical protein AX17_001495 [Amanita inopinata Kibby_2008]|nr:hypothetical protein AX17_001495 [Amanita inopinata Kibby_2008]
MHTSFNGARVAWHTLPIEMKLAVVDNLGPTDVTSLSLVDSKTYQACVPALFNNVQLKNFNALQQFLINVPSSYRRHIQQLDLCTLIVVHHNRDELQHAYEHALGLSESGSPSGPSLREQAEAVASLLISCSRLEELTIRMAGSMDKSVITAFRHLPNLKELAISNCLTEEETPVSERLVVHIAASIPALQSLSLDHISRSTMHAPDLIGSYPPIPLVINDDDIPSHPLLGSQLNLPSLLLLPTLRKLSIKDTHLGDPQWVTTPVSCKLETLHLGSCYHENEEFNGICAERILTAVGSTVSECSLTTAVSSDTLFAKQGGTPLRQLTKLHIAPFFPVESVADTMSSLAGSPIESVEVECFEADVVDVCAQLEEFLSLRVERGAKFFKGLRRVQVSLAPNEEPPSITLLSTNPYAAVEVASTVCHSQTPWEAEEERERMAAAWRLQEYCRDLKLSSVVDLSGNPPYAPTRNWQSSTSTGQMQMAQMRAAGQTLGGCHTSVVLCVEERVECFSMDGRPCLAF